MRNWRTATSRSRQVAGRWAISALKRLMGAKLTPLALNGPAVQPWTISGPISPDVRPMLKMPKTNTGITSPPHQAGMR
jgi:hypothetical protein